MQNPSTPTLPVHSGRFARYCAAPDMSLAAWSMARPIISRIASSGSPVCAPWKRSGASATNPSAASRSATDVM